MKTSKVFLLIISGPTGVGKSTVANAISEVLSTRGVHHAVIDLDHLRSAHPRPENDRFHTALGYKNLAAVWENYRREGITHIVIPNVTESGDDIEKIKEAVPGADVKVARIRAPLETIHGRLKKREEGDSLAWHLKRAGELNSQLEEARIENFVVETDNKTPREIAEEILSGAGWLRDK